MDPPIDLPARGNYTIDKTKTKRGKKLLNIIAIIIHILSLKILNNNGVDKPRMLCVSPSSSYNNFRFDKSRFGFESRNGSQHGIF